jgi:hypothetical protein
MMRYIHVVLQVFRERMMEMKETESERSEEKGTFSILQ